MTRVDSPAKDAAALARAACKWSALLAGALILTLWPADADTRKTEFADGAAEIALDPAMWKYDSTDDGVLTFTCVRKDCPTATILRLKSKNFNADEEKLGRGELLAAWAKVIVSSTSGGTRLSSIVPARRMKFGAVEGVMLRLRAAETTGSAESFESRLFWTPHAHKVINVNITTTEPVKGDILTRLQRATIPLLRLK
jgi:hypothetical protein